MRNKRILKYLVFLIACIAVDRGLGLLISESASREIRDNRIGLLVDGKIQSDVFVVGSSRALDNYNPALLGARLGKSVYNMGLSGSDVTYHRALIGLILQQPRKPELIIYSVDDHATFFQVENMVFRKDVMYPFVDHPAVNRIVSRQLHKNEWAARISWLYRENINWEKAVSYWVYGREIVDFKTNNLDSLGANLLVTDAQHVFPEFRQRKVTLDKIRVKTAYWTAFREIQEMCDANHVKIVFVLPPVFTNSLPGFKSLVEKAITGNAPLYDYSHRFTDSRLFYNVDHLNRKGADLFSGMLAGDIKAAGL